MRNNLFVCSTVRIHKDNPSIYIYLYIIGIIEKYRLANDLKFGPSVKYKNTMTNTKERAFFWYENFISIKIVFSKIFWDIFVSEMHQDPRD